MAGLEALVWLLCNEPLSTAVTGEEPDLEEPTCQPAATGELERKEPRQDPEDPEAFRQFRWMNNIPKRLKDASSGNRRRKSRRTRR